MMVFIAPKSAISVQLRGDLVIVEAIAYCVIHIILILIKPVPVSCMEASTLVLFLCLFIQASPLFCHLPICVAFTCS